MNALFETSMANIPEANRSMNLSPSNEVGMTVALFFGILALLGNWIRNRPGEVDSIH